MPQSMPRGSYRLATMGVCLSVVFGLAIATRAEANQSPTVRITSPLTGYRAGDTVTFTATGSDPDGSVIQIDLYVDSIWYATGYSDSHSISLPNVPAGTFRLTATAWDNEGVSASVSQFLTVTSAGSSPPPPPSGGQPSVSVTSPAVGVVYPVGSTVTFSATASDPDGIARIELYVDSIWYATGYSNSHSISLPNVPPGTFTLTAKAWDKTGASASANYTLTVGSSSGSANQPPSVSVTSPAIGAVYPVGATVPFSATASDPDGTIARIELYVDSIWYATAYSNSHSISLPNVPAGVFTLTATAWDDDGRSTSLSRILTVSSSGTSPPPPPSGGPPSISVTSPVAGTVYPVGSTVTFSATASDPDGIARIELYVDSIWYATGYSNSHSISLPNVPPGAFTLTAKAWDKTGASASAATTLTVGSSSSPPPTPSNQPPEVSLTAPANGATFTAPASMTLSATASDVDGTIAQVDFFANGGFLRTDTSSPYSFSWTNVTAGTYSITAVARDNTGATTVSSTRDIIVSSASLPSTAVFVPSSNHATAVDRYVLEVFPVGADPTVSNPVATRDLGKPSITNGECRVDVSSTILALTPGTYIATVTAMGSAGSAQSAASPAFIR